MRGRLLKALGATALGLLAGTANAQSSRKATPETTQQVVHQDEPLGGAARAAQAPSTLSGTCMDCSDCKKWLIGGGATLWAVTPAFDPNPAFRVINTVAGTRTATQQDFVWGLQFAYGGWIEANNVPSGTGVRGNIFTFHQSDAIGFTGNAGAGATQGLASAQPLGLGFSSLDVGFLPGETALFFSDMNIDIYDLEFTFNMGRLGPLDVVGFIGSRYAHLQQTYNATTTAASVVVPLGTTGVTIDSTHNFNGGGTTFGVDAKQRIGDSALVFFAKPRGSILVGSAREAASRTYATAPTAVAGLTQFTQAELSAVEILPIAEIESGVEIGRYFGRTRQAYAFASLGGFYQVFFGAGNAANNSNMNAAAAGGVGAVAADIFDPDRSNFGLWGATLRIGLTF